MTGNCVGWLGYAFLRHDIPLLLGNAPGFLVSIWLNLNAVKLIFQNHARRRIRESLPVLLSRTHRMSVHAASRASLAFLLEQSNENPSDDEEEDRNCDAEAELEAGGGEIAVGLDSSHSAAPPGLQFFWEQTIDLITLEKAPAGHDYMMIVILFVWLAIFSALAFIQNISNDTRILVIGIVVNCNLLFFYGGPLSTMFNVMKAHDSSSIHRGTMIMNTVNSTFWTAYGIGIVDWFVFVPNGIGIIMGSIQILLCIIFPIKVAGPSIDVTQMGDGELVDLAQTEADVTKSIVSASKSTKKVGFAVEVDVVPKSAFDDASP
jgi:solute carrier family 50 protein (sugar transporter)